MITDLFGMSIWHAFAILFTTEKQIMETRYYVVVSIEGDYANLRRTDIDSDDLKLVARALLPYDIEEGSNLKYEMMTYSMM